MSQSASQPVTPSGVQVVTPSTPVGTPAAALTLPHHVVHHYPHVAHQFEDAGQQKEAATLGMWLFLATEVLLFGGVIAAYIVYRYAYFPAFAAGANELLATVGIINTVILLTSSFFVVLAVHAAHHGRSDRVVLYLVLTIVLGLGFLGLKAYEYTTEYREGLVPFFNWWSVEKNPEIMEHWKGELGVNDARMARVLPQIRLFYIFYFTMTAIHAVHMIAGSAVLGWVAWQAHKGKFTRDYYNPVELAGLYWHFVDIVWVFLLPSLYLIKPH